LAGKTFLREATGLVREIGAFDAFATNFAVLSPGLGIVQLFTYAAVAYPRSDVVLGMTIALLPVVLWGIAYTYMSIASARTGGDYVWISRVLGAPIGFMISWVLLIVFFIIVGLNANLFATFYLSPMFLVLGHLSGASSLETLGASLGTPEMAFLLGSLVIIVIGAVAIFGLKYAMTLQRILLIVGVVGLVVIVGVLLSASVSQFSALFNAYASQYGLSYDSVIKSAEGAGYVPGFLLAATFMTLPYSSMMYGGFAFNVYAGSEIKNASRTQPIAILGCLVIGWFCFVIIGLGAYQAFGQDFLGAIGYLAANAPSEYTLPLIPTLPYLIGILANNIALTTVVEIGMMTWVIIIQIAYFIILPRLMFAMAFDRCLPAKVADVNERYHTPVKATLITIVFSIVGLYLFTFTTIFALLSNIILALTVVWLVAGVTGSLFPYRRKETFEAAPGFVKIKIAGVPLLTISGIVTVVFMIIASYFAWVASPLVNNLVIVGVFLSGLILYYVIRYVQSTRGVQLEYLFKEIPPE